MLVVARGSASSCCPLVAHFFLCVSSIAAVGATKERPKIREHASSMHRALNEFMCLRRWGDERGNLPPPATTAGVDEHFPPHNEREMFSTNTSQINRWVQPFDQYWNGSLNTHFFASDSSTVVKIDRKQMCLNHCSWQYLPDII